MSCVQILMLLLQTSTGITVQKIVGLSIMDLSIGKMISNEIGNNAVVVDDF